MSSKTDIQNKLVDFKVVSSPTEITISEPNDHGKLTVVRPNDDTASIYIGNTHIASGYGFNSPSTSRDIENNLVPSVNNLLQNQNLQRVLNGEYVNPNQGSGNQGGTQTEISDSSVNFNNATLSFINGELSANTWINIYNVELLLSNGNKLYVDNEYEYSMLSNTLRITRINFYYDIKRDVNNLKYIVDFSLEGLSNGSLPNGTNFSVTANGLKQYASISVNIELPRDSNKLSYEHPINLIITDGTNTTFINVCKVKYKYPIFVTAVSNLNNININASDGRIGLYDEIHGTDLTLDNSQDEVYNYIWVPSILSNRRFAIVYKPSGVGCNFTREAAAINIVDELNGVTYNAPYDRYRSPWQYRGTMIWTIK